MTYSYLIQNGVIVDGTGSPTCRGDLRVANGRIVDIAPSLERRPHEGLIDAGGCYVTPGFWEPHNHFDGAWPAFDSLPGYGITTSINGNCGFSTAPRHQAASAQKEMAEVPRDWRLWSEHWKARQRNVRIPVNFGAYVGHAALRLAALGDDAWNRVATAEEVADMCEMLEDALEVGALGLSSNLERRDHRDRPVLSQLADDAEWAALIEIIERFPGTTVQIVVDAAKRMADGGDERRLFDLVRGRGVRMQIVEAFASGASQRPLLSPATEISDVCTREPMPCGVGANVDFLTRYVRDTAAISIEEAIHVLTGKVAKFFGFSDRGTLKVGSWADLAVFSLDEIERRPERKTFDVPDGKGGRTQRDARDPAPMRLTMVNGVVTFGQGEFSGKFAGRYLGVYPLRVPC